MVYCCYITPLIRCANNGLGITDREIRGLNLNIFGNDGTDGRISHLEVGRRGCEGRFGLSWGWWGTLITLLYKF